MEMGREMEMARKMKTAREIEMGREMEINVSYLDCKDFNANRKLS
jgi:hypothetical protein